MSNKKPKVFIGSSSEAIFLTNAIHDNLRRVAEVTPWHRGVFNPSNYTLEDLEEQLNKNDFAIFVFHTDDLVLFRKQMKSIARDNVLLETGLFMGKLGRKRVFFMIPDQLPQEVIEAGADEYRLPSDLFGITPAIYEVRSDKGHSSTVSATGAACAQISEQIEKLGRLPQSVDYERQMEELHDIIKNQKREMDNLQKLLRFVYQLKDVKRGDNILYDDLLSAFQTSFQIPRDLTIKGSSIFRITEDKQSIEQIAKSGNVGSIGKTLPLYYENISHISEKINVVEAHKSGQVEIGLKRKQIGKDKEYLMSYPMAKKYVVTMHLLGNIDQSEHIEYFNYIDTENSDLVRTLNYFLEGEI